jgi:hypothetical protein
MGHGSCIAADEQNRVSIGTPSLNGSDFWGISSAWSEGLPKA